MLGPGIVIISLAQGGRLLPRRDRPVVHLKKKILHMPGGDPITYLHQLFASDRYLYAVICR